jgi:hypothetical protein
MEYSSAIVLVGWKQCVLLMKFYAVLFKKELVSVLDALEPFCDGPQTSGPTNIVNGAESRHGFLDIVEARKKNV